MCGGSSPIKSTGSTSPDQKFSFTANCKMRPVPSMVEMI
jgi:hypothetical protein